MIKQIITNEDLNTAIDCLENNYDECVYLYFNLRNFSIEDENVKAYIYYENDKIYSVFMQYFSTMHVYCRDNIKKLDFLFNEIEKLNPKVIFVQEKLACLVTDKFGGYTEYKMNVYNYPDCGVYDEGVIEAKREDYLHIAEFLYNDATYKKSYESVDELYNQLISRYDEGQGRYFYIKHEGRIVAVEGINSELNDSAVLGGLLVDTNMRGMGLAKRIKLGIHYILQEENKKIYCLINNQISENMTIKLGGYKVGTISKLQKREDK